MNQIQINNTIKINFATKLHSILQHDPNIILINEIQNLKTTNTSIQTSLTKHLIFSTLHTNDATNTTTQLLDINIKPFLISNSLENVLTQQLLRHLCSHCTKPIHIDDLKLPKNFLLQPENTIQQPTNYKECHQNKYLNRTNIFELLNINEHLHKLIITRTNTTRITQTTYKNGKLIILQNTAFQQINEKLTSISKTIKTTQT